MTKGKTGGFFHSTVMNFIAVLVASFIVSACIFLVLSAISDSVISRYVRNSNFVANETTRIVKSLQAFVTEKEISTEHIDRLAAWSKTEKYMHLIVFRQSKILFDSDLSSPAEGQPGSGTIYAPNYSISFTDGSAPIYIDSFYEYRFYDFAVVIGLIISFFVFTLIVVFFVARHLAYIRQIVFGVEVLEGGNLAYEIPVRGNDELASLAGSLNEMRKVFLRKDDKATNDPDKDIADLAVISHDLRTPLTTLILFIEIIKTKKDMTDAERDYYVQKLAVIANKIKILAENLEDFTSDEWRYSVALDEPRPTTEILREILPEAILFLEERGFTVVQKCRVKDECVRVNSHCIYRIIDNVVSNIDRYAAHEDPVTVITRREGETISVSFTNAISEKIPPMKTSKLGLSLVKEMMLKMNGTCALTKRSNRFTLKLTFPLASE